MRFLIVTAILAFTSCGAIAQNSGYISVQLMELSLSSDTVAILEDSGIFAKISDMLIIGTEEFVIKEHNTEELKSKLKVFVFEPDYDLLIFECVEVLPDKYIVLANNGLKEIPIDQKYIKFETEQQHILNNFIILKSAKFLKSKPSCKSEDIPHHEDNTYLPIEIKGDWLKVKCFLDCEGCFNSEEIEGWIKWRNRKKKLLVEVLYVC